MIISVFYAGNVIKQQELNFALEYVWYWLLGVPLIKPHQFYALWSDATVMLSRSSMSSSTCHAGCSRGNWGNSNTWLHWGLHWELMQTVGHFALGLHAAEHPCHTEGYLISRERGNLLHCDQGFVVVSAWPKSMDYCNCWLYRKPHPKQFLTFTWCW